MKFKIVVNDGNTTSSFDLENSKVSLGRSSNNDIQLNDKCISRNHLIMWGEDDRILAKDLGSENGTYINGRQMPSGKVVEVRKGHSILIGKSLVSLSKRKTDSVFVFLQHDFSLFQRISPHQASLAE